MKDYLEKRREELSKREGGFTLMEMLIVVAIIAVLIAIAIPIFTTQLEKSRESTDVANIRGAYAAGTVAAMNGKLQDGSALGDCYYNPGTDGSLTKTEADAAKLGQGTATRGGLDLAAIKGYSDYENDTNAQGKAIKVTFSNGMLDRVNFVE